jgi:hypothetical protein
VRRRDLLGGVWKRIEEHRAEGRAERNAERKRKRVSEQLDAGGAVRLPKYEHPEAGRSEQQADAAPRDEPDDK